MFPTAPYYGARVDAPPWPTLPDEPGEPRLFGPRASPNADVDCDIGDVLPPACPTQPGLAACRWGPGGPRLFPAVDPADPPVWLLRTPACWTAPTSALVGNFTRAALAFGVPDAASATGLTRTGLLRATRWFEPDGVRIRAPSLVEHTAHVARLWAFMALWPQTYAAFAACRHFSDGVPAALPDLPAAAGAYGVRVVAAALLEVDRQMLVLDMAKAWFFGDLRFAGVTGEELASRAFFVDETIADVFRHGALPVLAAASTSGAVLVPCFAPAFISFVRAHH